MTPEQIAATHQHVGGWLPEENPALTCETCALLAHIDALTAAVENMPTARIISQWDLVSRKAVLAILRCER